MADPSSSFSPQSLNLRFLSSWTIALFLLIHHQSFAFSAATTTLPLLLDNGGVLRGGSAAVMDRQRSHSTCNDTSTPYIAGGQLQAVRPDDPSQTRGPLKVLFLSSDTGGGHRASAESLAKQFLIHYPGSTYDLLDVWTAEGILPYSTIVQSYKHLSAHPRQWKWFYHFTNTVPWEIFTDFTTKIRTERRVRQRLAQYNPDVIVSVHPTMNHTPRIAAQKISLATGKHIPFFTVVTDLGSAHCSWFHKHVDKLYVASDRLYRLAKRRGGTPDEKIVRTGLPIRHEFAIQAARLATTDSSSSSSSTTTTTTGGVVDRTTPASKEYQRHVRGNRLNLPADQPLILIMGGGEGVGSLEQIVQAIYVALVEKGIHATLCVVCGRNEKLMQQLQEQDWDQVLAAAAADARGSKRRDNNKKKRGKRAKDHDIATTTTATPPPLGRVQVVGLGFVTNMDEYMVASDILVTKAGPGTIAEAAAVGLPVMLTSFLPGQEAGNVDYVLEKGFGEYSNHVPDIADRVSSWLQNPAKLEEMSHRARQAGHPHAAAEIVKDIGSTTHTWKMLNNA